MRIIGLQFEEKFGEQGVSRLVGSRYDEGVYSEALSPKEMEEQIRSCGGEPVLVLCHGLEPEDYSREYGELHRARKNLHTLFVSTIPMAHDAEQAGLERTHGLAYGIASTRNWEDHPPAVRNRMAEFLQDAARADRHEPQIPLLDLPAFPEHVIACYLAALAGRTHDIVNDEWRELFEDEVQSLRREHSVDCQLKWDDRGNVDNIAAFLREAQVTATHDVPPTA